jgi:hypothetical protein
MFGWSLPPGCSHRDIEEAMGGNGEAEAFWDMVWERPELAALSDEAKGSLTAWISELVGKAREERWREANNATALVADLEAEANLVAEWKASSEQVDDPQARDSMGNRTGNGVEGE